VVAQKVGEAIFERNLEAGRQLRFLFVSGRVMAALAVPGLPWLKV
jgi:hypothetical protein